jgi:hypothetical protein
VAFRDVTPERVRRPLSSLSTVVKSRFHLLTLSRGFECYGLVSPVTTLALLELQMANTVFRMPHWCLNSYRMIWPQS